MNNVAESLLSNIKSKRREASIISNAKSSLYGSGSESVQPSLFKLAGVSGSNC